MFGGSYVHHLDEMRAVDYGVELVAVYLDVVAHVSQFLDYAGIPLRVDILRVDAGFVVVVVERRFVATHVSFVQQEESLHRPRIGGSSARIRIGRGND